MSADLEDAFDRCNSYGRSDLCAVCNVVVLIAEKT